MVRFNPLSKDPDEINSMWFVPDEDPPAAGWLLYSEDFVLGVLQGKVFDTDSIQRTGGYRLAAGLIRAGMAVGQAVVMLLCMIPVLKWFMYMLIRGFPRNSVGFFLRGCYWKTCLARLGVDTLIDQGVEFNNPGRIEIGSRCHLDRDVLLSVGPGNGKIVLGNFVFMGPSCHVAGRGGVEIGDYTGLAARVHVYSVSNMPYNPEKLGELITMSHSASPSRQHTVESPVTIEPFCVVGLGSMLLPGASLGRGCIVHPYAEVSGAFPKFAVVSGHGRAKQTGWRRPGKLDPRLDAASNEDKPA